MRPQKGKWRRQHLDFREKVDLVLRTFGQGRIVFLLFLASVSGISEFGDEFCVSGCKLCQVGADKCKFTLKYCKKTLTCRANVGASLHLEHLHRIRGTVYFFI